MLAGLIVATLVFGFWGNWRYESEHDPEHVPDMLSVAYHSVQFLILHGAHLHDAVPWQLHLGRCLGALAAFTAGLMAFAAFFKQESLLCWLRMPWQRGQVLVCGLGDLGLRLALDARRRRRFVVAIEKHGSSAAVEQARRSGVLVVEGDACDPAVLKQVGIERADFLVAACANDATNVAVAALAHELLSPTLQRNSPLVCRLLLRDAELRRSLAERAAFDLGGESPNYRVNFRDLDLHDTAARQALRQYSLDFQAIRELDDTRVHLVVVGYGEMGQALAIQAARIGHFANGADPSRRLRITVVDGNATGLVAKFRSSFPKIDHVCELTACDIDPASPQILAALAAIAEEGDKRRELVTFGICLETNAQANDRDNLRLGLELSHLMGKFRSQLLLYQSTRCGFAALFSANAHSTQQRVYPFGMIEDVFTWDVLLHESEDRLARAVHEDYATHYGGKAWEQLEEHFQESNRHAADHIPVKLRALGYLDAPLQPGPSHTTEFSKSEILLLAQMEHSRWCAERWLNNWEYGPVRDNETKIHPDLVAWKDLPPSESVKDHEQIEAIPKILGVVGRGIYRKVPQ